MTMTARAVQKVEDGTPTRQRPEDQNSGNDDVGNNDAEHEVDDLTVDKPKKKRRIVKVSDRKYQCPVEKCGKAYSRAEHLSRHKLNHDPKEIFNCDFPGCTRFFVRADLRARHKERHTATGSHLQRKDAFRNQRAAAANQQSPESPPTSAGTLTASPVDSKQHVYAPSAEQLTLQPASNARTSMHAQAGASSDPSSYNDFSSRYNHPPAMTQPTSSTTSRRYSMEDQYRGSESMSSNGYIQQHARPATSMHPPPVPLPQSTTPAYSQHAYSTAHSEQYQPIASYPTPALPSFGLPPNFAASASSASQNTMSAPPINQYGMTDFGGYDPYAMGYSALPVFNSEGFMPNRSPPYALWDESFIQSLLEPGAMDFNIPSPSNQGMQYELQPRPVDVKYTPEEDAPESKPAVTPSTSWEKTLPPFDGADGKTTVSEKTQNRLISLLQSFGELHDTTGKSMKDSILRGDSKHPSHVLSISMIKTCLASYWVHTHPQMPILHRPTFNSETCPGLLLLSMMCLGACCLERTESPDTIEKCAELAYFSAYHIRWAVFQEPEFRPTAKLWTFQTMLLLELFEKMYSTRALHERAHIHHATTLTVMRRGSSLVGRSAVEMPAGGEDPTRTPPGPGGTINTSGVNTGDPDFNKWITTEATRRVAFAAFIIDSTHATLFGHSAVMAINELRLPLPCDEVSWSATSMAGVRSCEAALAANGFKTTFFLDGLKRTINGQPVRTNVFGRVILMAGLLNLSWSMNQRDLQVNSLGARSILGEQSKWRALLTRSFLVWKRDFDDSRTPSSDPDSQVSALDRRSSDNVSENRSCLHSLAHMSMFVNIVDCEIFAGSSCALGRLVIEADRINMQKTMRERWAPSAHARDATFYALSFLSEILMPDRDSSGSDPLTFAYSARDDYLLNRPWILYFAVMVVWSYGYALDGPLKSSTFTLTTRESQIHDMQRFLRRATTFTNPQALEEWRDRNECLGLLILMRECLSQPRWELLHEASDMLGLCIGLLMPGNEEVKRLVGEKKVKGG